MRQLHSQTMRLSLALACCALALTGCSRETKTNLRSGGGAAEDDESLSLAAPATKPSFSLAVAVGKISMQVSLPSGATSYNIYRATATGQAILYQSGVTGIYADAAIAPDTRYYYQVSAVNASGEGPRSLEKSVLSLHAAPALNGTAERGQNTLSVTLQ